MASLKEIALPIILAALLIVVLVYSLFPVELNAYGDKVLHSVQ